MGNEQTATGFDYEAFRQQTIAKMLAGDKELTGKDGLLAPLLKDLLNAALAGEIQAHVDENRPNRRNGSKPKTVKTPHGPLTIDMPRDRDASFEPKLIAKRQTTLGQGLDNRILALYGKGMSYEDIQTYLEELYAIDISTVQLSAITDKILPVIEQWRSRPLAGVYAFVWLDAMYFKVGWQGRQQSRL
jgi:putative transposase